MNFVNDYCSNMFQITWYMTVYVCMSLGFELLVLFVKFGVECENMSLVKNESDCESMIEWCYEFMFVSVLIAIWSMLINNKVLCATASRFYVMASSAEQHLLLCVFRPFRVFLDIPMCSF